MPDAAKTVRIEVLRYRAGQDDAPVWQEYTVPWSDDMSLLQALLHRYNADSRDAGSAERMQILNAEEGVWSCTAVGYCSEVCPKGVDPANAVNQNKVNSAKDYFLRFATPRGGRP